MQKSNKYLVSVLCLLAVAACGEKAKDDKMEDLALPLYEKMLSEKHYCKALEVTRRRFDYILDHQTSNEELNKRLQKWNVRAQAVELDCRKELWPAREANIQAEIKKKTTEYQTYQDLMKVSAFIPKNSFGRDAMERDCMYDVVIRNGSSYPIANLSFVPQKEFEMDEGGGYPGYDEHSKPQEVKPIAPGEERRGRVCDFSLGGRDSKLRTAAVDTIPLEVVHVVLDPSREMDLARFRKKENGYDFEKDIGELKKRLVDENPNLAH